jgi:plastocyanin
LHLGRNLLHHACVPRRLSLLGALVACMALSLSLAPGASAKSAVRHLHFKIGPYKIVPGQNSIGLRAIPPSARPAIDGYITRVAPNLVYAKSGKVPPVDVIHLHHGVWINASRKDATSDFGFERPFAAGEEKTVFNFPAGYGYWYDKNDKWLMNDMIHNLTTEPDSVYITWDLDFIPATAPAAKKIRALRPIWMDVENGSGYPVFNAHHGTGINGKYTYPDQAKNPYGAGKPKNVWTVDKDQTLVTVPFGHLHPGGLYDDLSLTRAGAGKTARKSGKAKPSVSGDSVHIFRSQAKYWEPAGAVSWDVAMTATPKNWPGVNLKKGDQLRITSTYDTSKASWYESMGIIIAFSSDGSHGVNPFKTKVDVKGKVTHGHLPENDNHGGEKSALPDARTLASAAAATTTLSIHNFLFGQGDLSALGTGNRPAVVKQGSALNFVNADADPLSQGIYHTITACKAPCNRTTGIAYPLANGPVDFDSGELGFGPAGITPAANRDSWATPADLTPGTYTYFCRIHPFMRGSFRVVS